MGPSLHTRNQTAVKAVVEACGSAPKKAKSIASAGKVMASVFWDAKEILLIDYLEKCRTLTDFHLFPHLKKFVSGKGFASNEEVERAVDEYFNSLPDSHFQERILILEKHWTKFVEVKREIMPPQQRTNTSRWIQVDAMVAELEWSRDLSQTIVHVDMDMFYAAVEMLDRPELRDVPMAVGTLSMLSTSNYVARKFGVRAAMPGFIGRKLCPQLVLVPHNFEKYKAASRQVQAILREYDPQLNTVSLDEAYLNISQYLEVLRREILSCSGHLRMLKFNGKIKTFPKFPNAIPNQPVLNIY
ncbi:POLK [Cordylochernes scorpioides]|uniref:POLK n=1 Tax=Cordylochernes scorpioides TaxID=51811 RepID=A0ABY6K3Q5_9ARAC|nr:POLK [Cordylochernes scorpioides]